MKSSFFYTLAIILFVVGILIAHLWKFPKSVYALALILIGGGLYEYAGYITEDKNSK